MDECMKLDIGHRLAARTLDGLIDLLAAERFESVYLHRGDEPVAVMVSIAAYERLSRSELVISALAQDDRSVTEEK